MNFQPTHTAGESRLAEFLPRAGHAYSNGRNCDDGVPAKGAAFDSAASQDVQEQVWVLRETDYKRSKLTPKTVLRGDAAETNAPFSSPKLSVMRVEDGAARVED